MNLVPVPYPLLFGMAFFMALFVLPVVFGIPYPEQYEQLMAWFSALQLNPEARHIWNYLTMNFTSMRRADLVEKAMRTDTELFRDDFDF